MKINFDMPLLTTWFLVGTFIDYCMFINYWLSNICYMKLKTCLS